MITKIKTAYFRMIPRDFRDSTEEYCNLNLFIVDIVLQGLRTDLDPNKK